MINIRMDTKQALRESVTQKMNPFLFFLWKLKIQFTWLKYRQLKTALAGTMLNQENPKSLKKVEKAEAKTLAIVKISKKKMNSKAMKMMVGRKREVKPATIPILITDLERFRRSRSS